MASNDISDLLIDKDLGPVSAYAMAVEAGYTGTEEQFAEDLANAGQNVQAVTEAAQQATAAASRAADAAATASAAYNTDLLAVTFDQTKSYAKGQHVIYSGKYYVLPNGHDANVTWENTTKTEEKVGNEIRDLKSAFADVSGNSPIIFSDPALKQYIDTSGSTVSWDTPSVGASPMKWAVIECQPGDQFTISGKGGIPNRLWAFADANKNILDPRAAVGENVNGIMLTAPDDAAYLIINDTNDKESYTGAIVDRSIDNLEQFEDKIVGYERLAFNKGTFINWVSSSAPWTYGAYNQVAATPAGIFYTAVSGDFIELTDNTGVFFNVYTAVGTSYKRYIQQTGKFVFPEDCEFAVAMQYNPGVALTGANYNMLIDRLFFARKDSKINKRIDKNTSDIIVLQHAMENVPAIIQLKSLFTNTNKYIDATTKLIENSTGQNVTSPIAVKQGDVINYLLRANSARALIIAVYSSSTPSADAYIDGVTGGPVSSDWHKGTYAITQDGYVFMCTRTDALQDSYAYISKEVPDALNLLWNIADPSVNTISQTLGNDPQSNYGERYTAIRNSGNPTPIANFQSAANDFLSAHAGDMRAIPLMIYTDMHMLATGDPSAVFNLAADILPAKEMSAYLSLGDIVNDHWTDDATYGLLKNAELEQFIKVTKALPTDKRIDVFGNHDTYYQPNGESLTALPNLKYVNPYFNNSNQRRIESCPDNSGNMVIYDGYYMVKYLVIADWDYTEAGCGYPAVSTEHWDWIIEQLAKVDDYDMVILSHIPLYLRENIAKNPYTGTVVGTTGYFGFVYHDDAANVLWTGRKNKTAGTFTDKSGATHSYDFTACKGDLLCSLHGHVHYDGYQYIDNNLLEITFDRFSNNNSIHFVLIDRVERKIKTWKWTINAAPINYELLLDTE